MKIITNTPDLLEFDLIDGTIGRFFGSTLLIIIGLVMFGASLNMAFKTNFQDANYFAGIAFGFILFALPVFGGTLYKISLDKTSGKMTYFSKFITGREKKDVYDISEIAQVQLDEHTNYQTRQQGNTSITYENGKTYSISLLRKSGLVIYFPYTASSSSGFSVNNLLKKKDYYSEARSVSELLAGFLGIPLLDTTPKPEIIKMSDYLIGKR